MKDQSHLPVSEQSLVYRLRTRAEIRRNIQSRKSVQEGQADRISDLLEEAASALDKKPTTDYETFVAGLKSKYPKMFAQPYGGVEVDAGWWPIIESLCFNIQSHIDWWNTNHETRPVVEQVVVEQIKEKFGGLRFYYQGGDDYISGLDALAESWAAVTCEKCGSPGSLRVDGWLRTLCDVHEAEHKANRK